MTWAGLFTRRGAKTLSNGERFEGNDHLHKISVSAAVVI